MAGDKLQPSSQFDIGGEVGLNDGVIGGSNTTINLNQIRDRPREISRSVWT
jgi:hypothetical protein